MGIYKQLTATCDWQSCGKMVDVTEPSEKPTGWWQVIVTPQQPNQWVPGNIVLKPTTVHAFMDINRGPVEDSTAWNMMTCSAECALELVRHYMACTVPADQRNGEASAKAWKVYIVYQRRRDGDDPEVVPGLRVAAVFRSKADAEKCIKDRNEADLGHYFYIGADVSPRWEKPA